MPQRDPCSTIFKNTNQTSLTKNSSLHRSSQLSTTYTHRKQPIETSNQDALPTPKISDFGFASHFQQHSQPILFTQFKGTRKGYMAPQIHLMQTEPKPYHAPPCDVFALGVILFTLIFQKMPFQYAVKGNKLYQLIIDKKYEDFWNFHSELKQLSLKEGFRTEEFKDLFQRMVSFDPKERPSAEEILGDPWLI